MAPPGSPCDGGRSGVCLQGPGVGEPFPVVVDLGQDAGYAKTSAADGPGVDTSSRR